MSDATLTADLEASVALGELRARRPHAARYAAYLIAERRALYWSRWRHGPGPSAALDAFLAAGGYPALTLDDARAAKAIVTPPCETCGRRAG